MYWVTVRLTKWLLATAPNVSGMFGILVRVFLQPHDREGKLADRSRSWRYGGHTDFSIIMFVTVVCPYNPFRYDECISAEVYACTPLVHF